MKNYFLNGKISLSSFSAPTSEDIELIHKLTQKEKNILLNEILEKAKNSPVSCKSIDDIWESAIKKSRGQIRHIIQPCIIKFKLRQKLISKKY